MALRSEFGHYNNITSATTTVVKTGPGSLYAVIVNSTVANGTITIYDNTAGSGTLIATVTYPATLLASQTVLPYFTQFTTGLTVVTTGVANITVIYQ